MGADLGRSARKHGDILGAARSVFLDKGYGAASMDEVAARAAVSKQTVYKHFTDKRRLFTEVITADIEAAAAVTHDAVAGLGASDDVEADLRAFARQHVVDVTRHHLVQLRRIVVAEADRFPDLARTWFERGPDRAHATLAAQFRALADRGLLRVDDPLLAAQHFNWLILSIPLNDALFLRRAEAFGPATLERYADEGVRVFLAAYGAGAVPER